jgi:GAF domain-containing protein
MGRRGKARFKMVLPVRISGADADGKNFNLLAYTLDISAGGARLGGISVHPAIGATVSVQYKQQRARFRVAWVGSANTAKAEQVGIEYLPDEKYIWIDLPSEDFLDEYKVPAEQPNAGPAAQHPGQPDIAARLKKCTEMLRESEQLIKSADVDPNVLREFHTAASHVRTTSWAMQRWLELRQKSDDPFPVLTYLNEQRLQMAAKLCHELRADIGRLKLRLPAEQVKAFVASASGLLRLLESPAVGPAEPAQADAEAGSDQGDGVAALAELDYEIRSSDLPPEAALPLVAERTRSLTGADGVAIALGNLQQMVCRASSGFAPSEGVAFQTSSGPAGTAVRTRSPFLCHDTETDTRVDAAACRSINLRSTLIVPILQPTGVMGILQLFSGKSNTFNQNTVDLLQRIAEMVSALQQNGAASSASAK